MADLDVHTGRLEDKEFRFWMVMPDRSLASVPPAGPAALPHCDLFVSRNDPPAL